jgi:hypothetical protein
MLASPHLDMSVLHILALYLLSACPAIIFIHTMVASLQVRDVHRPRDGWRQHLP